MNTNEQEVMDQEYMESVVNKEIPLIIYHASCMDGIASLWAAKQWFGEVEPFAGSYGKTPPDVTDRVVYILDFSYPREVLIEMHSKAKSLVVLDHHESAMQNLEGLEFTHFDMSRSGCALAWFFFYSYVVYEFSNGNHSCDCNRSLAMQRAGVDINDYDCGFTIKVSDFVLTFTR